MPSSTESHEQLARLSNEMYSELARAHGGSSEAVRWGHQGRQHQRFAELVKFVALDDAGATLLDVGCGNGELFKYLASVGYRGKYVGIDINRELLQVARARFKGADVRELDIMREDVGDTFTYVVMSGVFNVNLGQTEAWAFEFARRMFAHASQMMAFNAISTHVTRRDDAMFYLDPAETLRFCIASLSPRVTLAHHNVAYNFTVGVYVDREPHVVSEE